MPTTRRPRGAAVPAGAPNATHTPLTDPMTEGSRQRAPRPCRPWRAVPLGLATAALLALVGLAAAAEGLPAGVFATVNARVITGDEYMAVLRGQARQKFYHGQVPEAELKAFRKEVGQQLIRQSLLEQEAERRGVPSDEAAVARQLARIEQRYADAPQWAESKARILGELGRRLRGESRVAALEAQVRRLPAPSEAQVRAYYAAHPPQFTTPEQVSVSVILIRVPPYGPTEAWERARGEIGKLADRLRQGEDFGALARLHSRDPSAEEGGRLGFLHRDMLGDSAQVVIDRLAPGAVSAPVQLLEGIALFRLDARQPARLNPFDAVRERAEALWLRQAQDEAWQTFGDSLRKAALVRVDERYYQPSADELAAQGTPRAQASTARGAPAGTSPRGEATR